MLTWSIKAQLSKSPNSERYRVPVGDFTEHRHDSAIAIEFYISQVENFESITQGAKEVRLFTNHGNALVTLDPRSFILNNQTSKNAFSDLLCVLFVPLSEFQTKGPPMISLVCYDETTAKSVTRLQRGLEAAWFAKAPIQSSKVELGTISEFFLEENGSYDTKDTVTPRPSLVIKTKFIGADEYLWKLKSILWDGDLIKRNNPKAFTPDGIRETWKERFTTLKSLYPNSPFVDNRMEDIFLDRVILGGRNQDLALSFGQGFMAQCKKQSFDLFTFVGLLAIGHGLATGFKNLKGKGVKPAPVTASNLAPVIQASLTLLPSMIPYLDDSSRRLSSNIKFRVEEPSDPFETDCLDCEDGSRFICSMAEAMKSDSSQHGSHFLSLQPQVPLLCFSAGGESSPISPEFGKSLFEQIGKAMGPIHPCLALVDYITPGGGLMGMESHVPHATVILFPEILVHEGGDSSETLTWSISEGNTTSTTRQMLEGMMPDSVNPMRSHYPHPVVTIEKENEFFRLLLDDLWSDCRISYPLGPHTNYNEITKILGLYTTNGDQFTVMGKRSGDQPPTFGVPMSELHSMMLTPMPPFLKDEEIRYSRARGEATYPRKTIAATSTPSVKVLMAIGTDNLFGGPPVAKIHFPAFEMNKLTTLKARLQQNLGNRSVALLKIEIPGVVSPAVVLLSWL